MFISKLMSEIKCPILKSPKFLVFNVIGKHKSDMC